MRNRVANAAAVIRSAGVLRGVHAVSSKRRRGALADRVVGRAVQWWSAKNRMRARAISIAEAMWSTLRLAWART